MRGVLTAIAVLMLGALTVPGIEKGEDASRDPAPKRRGPVIAWDQPSVDVDGKEETLDYAEVALTDLETDLHQGGTIAARVETPLQPGPNEADLGVLFSKQPPGKVRVWVRAVDEEGNASDWAGPLEVEFHKPAGEEPPSLPPLIEVEPSTKKPAAADAPPPSAPGVDAPESPREVPRGDPLLPQQSRGGGCRLF